MSKRVHALPLLLVLALSACAGEGQPDTVAETTPTATESPTPSPTPASEPTTIEPNNEPDRSKGTRPQTMPVEVDGWRFGVAWTGFASTLGSEPEFTKPGEAYYTFRVVLVNVDDRRPEAPAGWLAASDFGFYLDLGDCSSGGQWECEHELGNILSVSCDEISSDVVGDWGEWLIPLHGTVEYECGTDSTYPEGLDAGRFSVDYMGDYGDVVELRLQT